MSRGGKAARLWLQACSVLLLGLALLASVAWAQEVEFSDPSLRAGSSADESAEPAEPGVVRVYFDDPAIARKIVISMEALESEYEKGYVVVLASEADLEVLRRAGLRVVADGHAGCLWGHEQRFWVAVQLESVG